MDIISAISGMIVFCGVGFCAGLQVARGQERRKLDGYVFASKHNDETGECESIHVEPEMVAKLRARMRERVSDIGE